MCQVFYNNNKTFVYEAGLLMAGPICCSGTGWPDL